MTRVMWLAPSYRSPYILHISQAHSMIRAVTHSMCMLPLVSGVHERSIKAGLPNKVRAQHRDVWSSYGVLPPQRLAGRVCSCSHGAA